MSWPYKYIVGKLSYGKCIKIMDLNYVPNIAKNGVKKQSIKYNICIL